jgi:hypothetical protein
LKRNFIFELANIMIKYLPFENITYRTKLDSEEIIKRINDSIEAKKTFRILGIFGNSNHKPYEGNINGNSFNISRIIGYRNSFLPRIKGEIEKGYGSTSINVKMKLHPFVLAFMCVWCGGVGLGFIAFLNSSIEKETFEPTIFIPFGMLIFGYGLTTVGFKYESIKSKKYLAKLFDAEIKK